MAKYLNVILIFGVLTGFSFPQTPVSSLTVTGEGEVAVQPDEATVMLGIVRTNSEAAAAQDEVNRAAQDILKALVGLGIQPETIRTSQLSLQPRYADNRPPRERGEPTIVGYNASYRMMVQADDLKKVGPIVDASLASGANRLDGIQFGVKDESKFRLQAMQMAVKEAMSKAQALASAAGVQLLSILDLREGGVAVRPVEMMQVARMEATATPVLPGQVTIRATVTLQYAIGKP